MASRLGLHGILDFLKLDTDPEASAKLDMALLMSNTTAGTQNPLPATVSGFTTLDECDDTSYARQTLTGVDVQVANNTEIHCPITEPTFANDGDATRSVTHALVFIDKGADSSNIPVAVIQLVTKTLDGVTYEPAFDTSGIFLLTTKRCGASALIKFLEQDHDPETANKLRMAILDTTTTALTQADSATGLPATVSGITTLGECDAAGYARQVLTGVSLSVDATKKRLEFDITRPTFPITGAGTNQGKALLVYLDAGGSNLDSANIPLVVQEIVPTTFSGSFQPPISSSGVLHLVDTN